MASGDWLTQDELRALMTYVALGTLWTSMVLILARFQFGSLG